MKYLLYTLLCLLLSCSSAQNGERVAITGLAQDAKWGAVIITDDKTVYYIDGMDKWDKQLYGSTLTVWGYLDIVETLPAKGNKQKQQITGIQKLIRKPRILL